MTAFAREDLGELRAVFWERLNKRTTHNKTVESPKTPNVTCSDCSTSPEKKAKNCHSPMNKLKQ